MKVVIDFMNWLTDMDWGWWPLLSARPSKERPIDIVVLAKITPFFGTLAGLLIAVIANHFTSLRRVLVDVGLAWVLFFIGYRLTFAIAWNSRARLLRRVFAPVASPNGSSAEPLRSPEAGGEPPSVR